MTSDPLVRGQYYHIYNRGNNGETIFREARNYSYFLKLYAEYVEPVAETYAYCLLPNHFHLLVRILECQSRRTSEHSHSSTTSMEGSRALAGLFGTYTKAFNKACQRTGSLFEKPFHRKRVDKDRYFTALVVYIHHNPQRHGLVDDFRKWHHSSYRAILSDKPTLLRRDDILEWFDGRAAFEMLHSCTADQTTLAGLIVADEPA